MTNIFAPHVQLAAILLDDELVRAMEFARLLPEKGVKPKRTPVVPAPKQALFAEALRQVFAVESNDPGINAEDLGRNERLKREIIGSPDLVIAVLGDDKALVKLRDQYVIPLESEAPPYAERDVEKRATLELQCEEMARAMMLKVGILLPAAEPVVFTSVIEANGVDPEKGVGKSEVSSNQPRVLTEDEIIELMIKRDEAFSSTKERLLGNAGVYVLQAQSARFNMFECYADWNKAGLPIILRFSKETGEGEDKKIETRDFSLKDYDGAYKERGITITPREVLLLISHIEEQLLREGIISAIQHSGVREANLRDLDRFVPHDPELTSTDKRGMYYLSAAGFSPTSKKLEIEEIDFPLGLAVQDRESEAEKAERAAREEFIRTLIKDVSEARGPRGSQCSIKKVGVLQAYRAWLKEEGREWVTAERWILPPKGMDPGQFEALENGEKEAIRKLPGFHKPNLLCVSRYINQNISLATVVMSLDIGGENASWHADISFHRADMNSSVLGDYACSATLNLQTRDEKLAIARTWESLTGTRSSTTDGPGYSGLFQQLRNLAIATGQEWQIENDDTRAGQIIVCRMLKSEANGRIQRYNDGIKAAYPIEGVEEDQRIANLEERTGRLVKPILWSDPNPGQDGIITLTLQHLFDDMIRYERDVGVRQIGESQPDSDGNVVVTLRATRSNFPDYGKKIPKPRPEDVYEKDRSIQTSRPVEYSLSIPGNQRDKIPAFISAVEQEMQTIAERETSSESKLGDKRLDGKEAIAGRKSPRKYRARYVRYYLATAIERTYAHELHFGHSLPKDWQKPKAQAALSTSPIKDVQAYRPERPSLLGEDRHVRHVRRSRTPLGSSPIATLG